MIGPEAPNNKAYRHLMSAEAILSQMDDDITERGGDEDESGRRQLAKIRRAKDLLRKAAAALVDAHKRRMKP